MPTTDHADRLLANIEFVDGHWLWRGARSGGYGMLWVAGRSMQAHRVAYQTLFGELPPGVALRQTCEIAGCVSPWCWESLTLSHMQL